MTENISSITDPSVSFKVTSKIKVFFKEHKKELCNFKEPVPKNILGLDLDQDTLLKVNDIEWLNSFLNYKREVNFGKFQPLTGPALDKEILALLKNEKNCANTLHVEAGEKYSNIYLHELLESSVLILPKNEVVKRNPVLAARIEKLKRDQEERDYKAMTRNVDPNRKFVKEETLSYQMNMMNRHLIAVGQFIISVAAGFAFGFLGVELLTGGLEFGFRLLLGIACALIIALAEFYFLAKHLGDEESPESTPRHNTFRLSSSSGGKAHKE